MVKSETKTESNKTAICPEHKKEIIYTYFTKSYCSVCLDDMFENIYDLKQVFNQLTELKKSNY